MESASLRIQPAFEPDPRSFPPRTHPSRPPEPGQRDSRGARPGDGRYPLRCNPHRTRPPLDEGQRELATRYLPLARSMAGRMGKRLPGASDELQSVASLALVEAAQSFDPSRNVNFATFARLRIQGALLDLRREIVERGARCRCTTTGLKRRRGEVAGSIGRAEERAIEVPIGTEMETLDTVEHWIRRLPRSHAQAFRHIYLNGRTQEETAILVGCSKSTMCRLHSQGLYWLQQDRDLEMED